MCNGFTAMLICLSLFSVRNSRTQKCSHTASVYKANGLFLLVNILDWFFGTTGRFSKRSRYSFANIFGKNHGHYLTKTINTPKTINKVHYNTARLRSGSSLWRKMIYRFFRLS